MLEELKCEVCEQVNAAVDIALLDLVLRLLKGAKE